MHIVGLGAAQGAGKSTLAAALAARDPRLLVLSLDDFYLTRAERGALADAVHPLFTTRGPPGTHDLDLLHGVLARLAQGVRTRLPRFDKRSDDRLPESTWPIIHATPRAILLEGWCVGATAQPESALTRPINALEAMHDPLGVWRRRVNTALAHSYAGLWDRLDDLLYLSAPDFAVVADWRLQQEGALQGLACEALGHTARADIQRFVAHFERITRHMLDGGLRARLEVRLDHQRRPISAPIRRPAAG
jgi:D-glycerate 3-kinase